VRRRNRTLRLRPGLGLAWALCGVPAAFLGCEDGTLELRRVVQPSGGSVASGGGVSVGGVVSTGGQVAMAGSDGTPEKPACPGPNCTAEICAAEFDCSVPLTFCPGWAETCGTCRGPADCELSETCDAQLWKCVPRCSPVKLCPLFRPHCDEFFGACNECGYGAPCRFGFECLSGECVACAKVPWCTPPPAP